MKPKKAQLGEFLMTYGWAILIVLIAVGAFAYFGVLNPLDYENCLCQDLTFTVEFSTIEIINLSDTTFLDLTSENISMVDNGTLKCQPYKCI